MPHLFRLFWLRESGRDLGTPLQAAALDPQIRDRVVELAGPGDGEIALRLPFLDRRDWRRRAKTMPSWRLERRGDTISCALTPAAATRDLAATLVLADPAWMNLPGERDPHYFATWRQVSLTLQTFLRTRIAAEYFRDITRYQDRAMAYPMLIYRSTRLCFGRVRPDFTYDLSDYPSDRSTLLESWRMIGRLLQDELARVERRLHDAGMPALARRYAPMWHEDVLAAVRKKPKRFVRCWRKNRF